MERIRVKISTINPAGIEITQKGEILSFGPDGNAVVMITEGAGRGYFKRVNLNRIQALFDEDNETEVD